MEKETDRKVPVLVTDAEKEWLARGITTMIDLVTKRKKGLEELGLDATSCVQALRVMEGNGANGGLVTRFATRDQRDILDDPEPTRKVRQLFTPKEGVDPLTLEPAGDEWVNAPAVEALANEEMDVARDVCELYYEDAEGRVFLLSVESSVFWKYVGERSSAEVDQSVEASDRAAGNVDSLDGLAWASASARELARTEGLPVEALAGHGTGSGGKLTKRDVLDALADRDSSEAPESDEGEGPELVN
jgi:pyruvate/2-oxoglutarate dehydrogenase complex dihydrolipoamide acyltransferase (E2) component